jgi:hypothetical protein
MILVLLIGRDLACFGPGRALVRDFGYLAGWISTIEPLGYLPFYPCPSLRIMVKRIIVDLENSFHRVWPLEEQDAGHRSVIVRT